MAEYLAVRLLDDKSHVLSGTKSFGNVDIRKIENELHQETQALIESLTLNNLTFNLDLCPRITTIVNAETDSQAFDKSHKVITEMLDLFDSYSMGMKRTNLINAGYLYNFTEKELKPLEPSFFFTSSEDLIPRAPVFHVNHGILDPLDHIQSFMQFPRNELIERVYRAAYWKRLGKYEKNYQLQIIFYWFCLETLCKVQQEEDIISKILIGLGFANAYNSHLIDLNKIRNVLNKPNYRTWRNYTENKLIAIRNFRHESVHSGYRIHELQESEIQTYINILQIATTRIEDYIIKGIIFNRLLTIEDIWEFFPKLVENNPVLENGYNSLIYFLENPDI